jgi:hypothetical protein
LYERIDRNRELKGTPVALASRVKVEPSAAEGAATRRKGQMSKTIVAALLFFWIVGLIAYAVDVLHFVTALVILGLLIEVAILLRRLREPTTLTAKSASNAVRGRLTRRRIGRDRS